VIVNEGQFESSRVIKASVNGDPGEECRMSKSDKVDLFFDCVLCHSESPPLHVTDSISGDRAQRLRAVQCLACGHVQLSPPEYDLGFYEEDGQVSAVVSSYGTPMEKVFEHSWIEARRRVKRFADRGIDLSAFGTVPRVLDVGGGYGFFAAEFKRQLPCADVTVLEPSAMRIELGREQLRRDADLAIMPDFRVGLLDQAFVEANRHAFDLVTMWHVLEHVPDPVGLMKLAMAVLRPKAGRFCIEVPNLNAELMALSPAFRKRHFMMEHISYFNEVTLEATARRAVPEAEVKVFGYQRYGIFNAAHWIEFNKPQGANPDLFPGCDRWWLEATWRRAKEETRTSDALFMIVAA
jgi:2-polyprenyl-3-methyl-5-hydroxy-6-metoxy-1,4-benzoquinol methylase